MTSQQQLILLSKHHHFHIRMRLLQSFIQLLQFFIKIDYFYNGYSNVCDSGVRPPSNDPSMGKYKNVHVKISMFMKFFCTSNIVFFFLGILFIMCYFWLQYGRTAVLQQVSV
jgi:hypothetical protein